LVEGFGLVCSAETITPYMKTEIQVERKSIVVVS
jgi:hypothetical protein